MRTLMIAGLGFAMLGFSLPSQAAPLALQPTIALDSGVVLVSGGCGFRGFRAPNGYCYPRRPGPPPIYRRGCGPRFHPTPYGCRPNY